MEEHLRRLEKTRTHLQETKEQVQAGRSARELMRESAYARLQARLVSLPVIEQAKGILIAQTGCGPEEAFDLLRRASQRSNIKVRDLAADIVQRTANSEQRRGAARADRR
jgi:AmiR/NasT family two-component response regulator